MVRFIPGNNEEKEAYIKLYSYLNSRSRCGVVADSAKNRCNILIVSSVLQDICVVRFIPGNNEEKEAYIKLYSYLNSRSRCGVVADSAKHIKDFYIVPLASHSKIPAVLKPFDGPGK